MLFIRLRGWLTRYIWPDYAQRMLIQDAKREINGFVRGDANYRDDKRPRPGG
jgi:hypothetical protein